MNGHLSEIGWIGRVASGVGGCHHAGMSRRLHFLCLLLASACGPGSGGSSGESTGDSSGGGTSAGTSTGDMTPTTGSSTSGPGTTSDPDTGGTTIVTGAGTTTDATTDPSGTTGPQACEAIVGSTDCAALAEVSIDLSLEDCIACQATPCGADPLCDGQYPCIDGEIVIKGCCSDAQCAGLTPFCGMFIGTNNVCVLQDDR